jgi:hypothetical protein
MNIPYKCESPGQLMKAAQNEHEGDGEATVNLIPMETVIVVLNLEHNIGN